MYSNVPQQSRNEITDSNYNNIDNMNLYEPKIINTYNNYNNYNHFPNNMNFNNNLHNNDSPTKSINSSDLDSFANTTDINTFHSISNNNNNNNNIIHANTYSDTSDTFNEKILNYKPNIYNSNDTIYYEPRFLKAVHNDITNELNTAFDIKFDYFNNLDLLNSIQSYKFDKFNIQVKPIKKSSYIDNINKLNNKKSNITINNKFDETTNIFEDTTKVTNRSIHSFHSNTTSPVHNNNNNNSNGNNLNSNTYSNSKNNAIFSVDNENVEVDVGVNVNENVDVDDDDIVITRWQCDYCSKSYKRERDLKRHIKIHDPSHPGCPYCGKKFARNVYLQDHIRTHTGERPFPCKICGKHFSCKRNLAQHNQIHKPEKPLLCKVCNYRCRALRHMKSHYKVKHNMIL